MHGLYTISDFLYRLQSGLQIRSTVGNVLPNVLNISAERHDSADRTVAAPTIGGRQWGGGRRGW